MKATSVCQDYLLAQKDKYFGENKTVWQQLETQTASELSYSEQETLV